MMSRGALKGFENFGDIFFVVRIASWIEVSELVGDRCDDF
jgi:hypothetical protein